MKVRSIVLLATTLLPLAAVAEETQGSNPFAGAYVGIYGGHADAEDDGKGYSQFTGARNGWSQDASPKGGVYGLKAGYNWVLDNSILLAVEADYEGRSKNEDEPFQKLNGVTNTNFSAETQLNQAGYLLGRAGYLFNDKGLVYVTGGYAAVEAKRTWETVPTGRQESHTDWQDGWAAGVGAEYLLTENIAASIEYRYADYGTKKVDADLWNEYYKQDLTEESWLVGASYHF